MKDMKDDDPLVGGHVVSGLCVCECCLSVCLRLIMLFTKFIMEAYM